MTDIMLLESEAIISNLRVNSKKQILQKIATKAAELTKLPERDIFDVLLERERLGTTGVGNGIAIPHGKLSTLPSLFGLFAKLDSPVDFEAIDDQPVDLIFLLLAPEGAGADHLKALARISRTLRNKKLCEKLRSSDSNHAIYTLLTEDAESHAA